MPGQEQPAAQPMPQPQMTQQIPQQQIPQQQYVQQPQYMRQPQYVQQPAPVEVSVTGLLTFVSVIIMLAGIAFGMVVMIKGGGEVSDWNKLIGDDKGREAELAIRSVAIPILSGLAIVLLSIIQFAVTHLLVKTMKRVDVLEAKTK